MNIKEIETSKTLISGKITEMKCIETLLSMGYIVSIPELPCPYDFLLDTGKNILKIQVKTCRKIKENILEFSTSSKTHNSKGYTNRIYKNNCIDYFATFYDNQCFLIPASECGNYHKKIHLGPTKNNQQKNVCFAKDYFAEKILSGIMCL